MPNDPKYIKKHESPLRRMIADSHNKEYEALHSLDEARKTKNAYLIMEGDDGGQIYLVVPVGIIKCDEAVLKTLLYDLDAMAWDDSSMAGLYYEIHEADTVVAGGMGGGRAEKNLWVHKDFDGIKDKIKKVIVGETQSIHN